MRDKARSRWWTYLAVIAVAVFWGLPEIVLWGLCAVMAVDLIRGWAHSATRRLEACTRELRADPVTAVTGPDGEQRRISPGGLITRACAHSGAVEVRRTPVPAVGVGDDIVAWYCPACEVQLPADWVPGIGPVASLYLNVEQQTRIRAAFLRGAKTRAPVWITGEWPPYGPLTTESYQQIVDSGHEPIETTGLGDLTRTWVRGRPTDG